MYLALLPPITFTIMDIANVHTNTMRASHTLYQSINVIEIIKVSELERMVGILCPIN
jgi:hypothetical protein